MKKRLLSIIVLSFLTTSCIYPIASSASEITNSLTPIIIISDPNEITNYTTGDVIVSGYKINIYSDYVGQGCANRYDAVMAAQILLNQAGCSIAKDGIFGNETRNAIINYQNAAGLTCDAVIGPNTWKSLLRI